MHRMLAAAAFPLWAMLAVACFSSHQSGDGDEGAAGNGGSCSLTGAPDLVGHDLSGCDLSYADLTFADLREANLTGADLRHATLHVVTLDGADLTNADMTGADLEDAVGTAAHWDNTTCPDGTNSDGNDGTCRGHLLI